MQHEIQRMAPRHFRILELCLQGHSKKVIAEALGMTPQAISLITNSPLFQDQLARRRGEVEKVSNEAVGSAVVDARNTLVENAQAAANKQVDLLNAENESVQLHAATAILDRVMEKKDGDKVTSPMIQTEQLNVLVLALKESKDGRSAIDLREPITVDDQGNA